MDGADGVVGAAEELGAGVLGLAEDEEAVPLEVEVVPPEIEEELLFGVELLLELEAVEDLVVL